MPRYKDGTPRSVPAVKALDPFPYVYADGGRVKAPRTRKRAPWGVADFSPRPGFSQDPTDYGLDITPPRP